MFPFEHQNVILLCARSILRLIFLARDHNFLAVNVLSSNNSCVLYYEMASLVPTSVCNNQCMYVCIPSRHTALQLFSHLFIASPLY